MQTTRTLEEAIEQGFVVSRSSTQVRDRFFHWCEQNDRPYVTVWLKTKYAMVEIDLIAQTWQPSTPAAQEIDALLAAANVGPRGSNPAGTFTTIDYADRVPIEKAGAVARQIVAILARLGSREATDRVRGNRHG